MPSSTLVFDTSILPTDALSFYDDNFYQLVEKIAGLGEAKLLEVQGIRSVYSFFNIEDVFNILSFSCSAIKEIKKLICLEDDDKNYMVKPGCRSNIRYLYQLLYQKHEEHLKEITPKSKRNKQSQLHQSNSTTMNLSQDSSQNTSILSNHQQSTTTPNLMNILNHHGVLIHMLNEWFERNFRTIYILNGNLIENEDYKLLIAFNGTSEEACITCFCGVKVRLTRVRENFSLSNYYKHLKTKSCVNTFHGFSTPLRHGIPISRHFQTDSFDELQGWFENTDRANYQKSSHAAYGISNKFKAVDVLHRWIWEFEKSRESSVRIVAFATDCDPRYLLAMRLATSFFAKYNNYSMYDHPNALEIDLPKDWRTWFFMSTRQVFFCFQDPMHLCTKLRNRILSNTASMLIGKEAVSIEVLMELVQNTSKLSHGLVKTDIDPKDRLNVSSCLKLASDDVSLALENINNSLATRIYLYLLRCIVLAYVEHNTSIVDRIYNS
ncbi:unnamed protein product [Adineta steineri]|uniref:Uncharacterized protein n=1 Tax=Adineta steineri TaxID=433720 RepID=A0A814N3R2_9BILA|nr:unnamed protein product [Adineta steineri]